MSLDTFTAIHVIVSLIGIGSGFVIAFALVNARRADGWTALFLLSTVATSATGFGFPIDHLLPSHIVGAISLTVLAIATAARYAFHLAGVWRRVYVIAAMTALYLNVFVLVVQLFRRVPVLIALAPTQSEPPFAIVQLFVLVLFVVLTAVAVRRFRGGLAVES